ncbi:flippase [Daejeonella lutea]|uniref:Membrane protein involved in the export of O-antigen and teichoic acid n=1 Tax=Daejeonella lutea TaxID=572036 RepID=A0A1T5EDW8_9SPHI|nr:flippase [Daejeonella lutea]SKB82317.1 Membrane protein involved in the export of O-antigen and teichoic acid [Daejeonella lutea]
MKRPKEEYWMSSAFYTVLQNLTGVAFTFGGFYFLVRLLNKHQFGVWALYMSTVTILEFMRGGLIQNALIKYLAFEKKEEHTKIISASFSISAILTLLCILLNFLLARILTEVWDAPELLEIFHLYSWVFVVSGILTMFNSIEQANLEFKGVFVGAFVRQGIFFLYIFYCYFFSPGIILKNLVYAQFASFFISAIVSYFFSRKYFDLAFQFSYGWAKKLFNYGKYAFGTSLSSILSTTIDQMMLGAILSPVASGAFNIAVRITNLIDIPTNAIAIIVFPQSARRSETEGKHAVKYLYEKSVGVLMAILIPGVFLIFCFADIVVLIVAGDKYDDAVPLLKIVLLYCLFIPYARQFGNILDSIGKPKLNFYMVVITAAINIALNYLFISRWGVMGAAYATLCSSIVGFFLSQFILKRELNVQTFNTLKYAWEFYPEFYNKYVRPLFKKA